MLATSQQARRIAESFVAEYFSDTGLALDLLAPGATAPDNVVEFHLESRPPSAMPHAEGNDRSGSTARQSNLAEALDSVDPNPRWPQSRRH